MRAGVGESVTDLRGRPHNGQAGDSVARRVISTLLRAAVHIVVIDQAAVAILVSVVIPMMRRVHAIVALGEERARLQFPTVVLRGHVAGIRLALPPVAAIALTGGHAKVTVLTPLVE